MTVRLITHMGTDLTVVNAARVSFDKESDWDEIPFAGKVDGYLSAKDEKLIKYLAKHNHWTPFGHCSAQFRIKAPIFVARQLAKHQVGLVWNEVSRRYVKTDPEFWMATYWRQGADDVKQGSSPVEVKSQSLVNYIFSDAERHCADAYKAMLKMGVCAEQARAILPQSMLTEWYWSGTLMAFARVYGLRKSKDTQLETNRIVLPIGKEMERLFPISWRALCGI